MAEDIVSLIDTEPPNRYRFDYKGKHRYLITLPVYASKKIFTEQRVVVAVLNCLRDTALKHHFDVYAYCLLPDQMVMIVRGKDDDAEMKGFLSEFRTLSSTMLEGEFHHPLWKKKYLERVLRKKEDTRRIADNIFQMPVKAGLAQRASDYPFQGSFVVIPKPRHF
jgi:REP element-mobilizing transposase RayT